MLPKLKFHPNYRVFHFFLRGNRKSLFLWGYTSWIPPTTGCFICPFEGMVSPSFSVGTLPEVSTSSDVAFLPIFSFFGIETPLSLRCFFSFPEATVNIFFYCGIFLQGVLYDSTLLLFIEMWSFYRVSQKIHCTIIVEMGFPTVPLLYPFPWGVSSLSLRVL